jgi:hypothetical protein
VYSHCTNHYAALASATVKLTTQRVKNFNNNHLEVNFITVAHIQRTDDMQWNSNKGLVSLHATPTLDSPNIRVYNSSYVAPSLDSHII